MKKNNFQIFIYSWENFDFMDKKERMSAERATSRKVLESFAQGLEFQIRISYIEALYVSQRNETLKDNISPKNYMICTCYKPFSFCAWFAQNVHAGHGHWVALAVVEFFAADSAAPNFVNFIPDLFRFLSSVFCLAFFSNYPKWRKSCRSYLQRLPRSNNNKSRTGIVGFY